MTRENLLEKVIKKIEEIEPDKWVRSENDDFLTAYSTNLEEFGIMLFKDLDYESRIPTYVLGIYNNGELVAYFNGANKCYKNPAEERRLIENLFYKIEGNFKDFKERKTQQKVNIQPTETDLLLENLLGKLGGK